MYLIPKATRIYSKKLYTADYNRNQNNAMVRNNRASCQIMTSNLSQFYESLCKKWCFFRNGIKPARTALPCSSLIMRWTLKPIRCCDMNCVHNLPIGEVKEVENADISETK